MAIACYSSEFDGSKNQWKKTEKEVAVYYM